MSLENTYSIIKKKFEKDLKLEPFSVVNSVDEHRRYWKPDNVRVLLLAESHVFTSGIEHNNFMKYPVLPELGGCPTNYVKLVYCLGYGERNLVNLADNSGTWQYWRIFTSCVNQDSFSEFGMVEIGKTPSFNQRLSNKISLLEKLKENGIWLLDASIVALYRNNDPKQKKKMKEIIKICWNQYISPTIKETNPEKIIVIGKGVAKILNDELYKMSIPIDVQKQPNGIRNSDELEQSFRSYYKLCNY